MNYLTKETDELFFEFAIKLADMKFDGPTGFIDLQKMCKEYAKMADKSLMERLRIEIGRSD